MTDTDALDPVGAIVRSWWVILLAVVVGAVAVGAAVATRPVRYTSTAAVVYTNVDPSEALLGVGGGGSQGDPARVLNTQLRVAVSDAVLSAAAGVVGLDPALMPTLITVDLEPDSNVIRVRGTGDSAAGAQQVTAAVVDAYLANDRQAGHDQLLARVDAVAATIASLNLRLDAFPPNTAQDPRRAAFAGQIATLAQQEEQLRTAAAVYPGHVSVLSAADVPRQPSSPDPRSAAVAGAGLGLIVGILVGVLRAPRRRTVAREAQSVTVPRSHRRVADRPTPLVDTRVT